MGLSIKSSKKPQIKNFHKTDPPQSGNSDSKYNFKIFKNQKSNPKKTPYSSKKSKTYISRPQIQKFYKTDPQKWEFSFKIQFQNFQKPKIKLKKDPLKFQKIKNIYKEAFNEIFFIKQTPKKLEF